MHERNAGVDRQGPGVREVLVEPQAKGVPAEKREAQAQRSNEGGHRSGRR